MRKFISLFAVALSGCAAANTPGAKNPLLASSSAFYAQVKEDVLRSAEKMPEEKFRSSRLRMCVRSANYWRMSPMHNSCYAALSREASPP
jgi:hypothetical protein